MSPLFSPGVQPSHVQSLWQFLDTFATPERRDKVEGDIAHMTAHVREVEELLRVPQSGPWHIEGFYVRDHLAQALLGLRAVLEDPDGLLATEEFAEHKDLETDLRHLFSLVARHEKFLTAYIFAHDLGKAVTTVLWNGQGAMPTRSAAPSELERFDKERRAFFVHRQGSTPELGAAHFAATGLRISYPRHGFEGAGERYREAREKILGVVGAGTAYAKLLTELIRGHIDVTFAFDARADEVRMKALSAIAGRAGVAADVFLDLIPACTLLDMMLGSRPVDTDEVRKKVVGLRNYYAAERVALAHRAEERVLVARRAKRAVEDGILRETKLDADSIFALLGTPVGPARGQVMADVFALLKNPDAAIDLGAYTDEIRVRARAARDIFLARGVQSDKL